MCTDDSIYAIILHFIGCRWKKWTSYKKMWNRWNLKIKRNFNKMNQREKGQRRKSWGHTNKHSIHKQFHSFCTLDWILGPKTKIISIRFGQLSISFAEWTKNSRMQCMCVRVRVRVQFSFAATIIWNYLLLFLFSFFISM